MPEYRRYIVPGATYFFTVVVMKRARLFDDPVAISLLGSVFRRCQMRWPFQISAIVLLHDHWHSIWTLPPGDDAYSKRIGWIKKEFTQQWVAIGGVEQQISEGKQRQRRRGIWQPRFWEHTIEDESDFQNHFDFLHWNPVKHGLVQCPRDWPYSSFHRWVNRGVYAEHWGCFTQLGSTPPPTTRKVNEAGEP